MSGTRTNASDATYHGRHARRTLRRAEQIAANFDGPARVLDVGCNNGLTSRFLLDSGAASHVTGIELVESTVDGSLRRHPDFSLIEGNILDIDLDEKFDVIIYGAVHHHILRFNGLTSAIQTFQRLFSHCNRHMFFETGQLGEGGRWPWQQTMRRYFRTDEEHFFYLLRSVEQDLEDFEIIGRHWIHGIRRAYFRLDVSESTSVYPHHEREIDWPGDAQGPFVRSFGSANQSLMMASDAAIDDSPTHFWTSASAELFIKQHRHHPIAAGIEGSIGSQLSIDQAVSSQGRMTQPDALAFQWLVNAKPITHFSSSSHDVRRNLADNVIDIHVAAHRILVDIKPGALLQVDDPVRLVDVCDLNVNNLLVDGDGAARTIRMIDFEQQGVAYRHRNRLHQARALRILRQYRTRAFVLVIFGCAGLGVQLIASQIQSLERRIRDRRPALCSLLVSDLRTLLGRATGVVLGAVGLGER